MRLENQRHLYEMDEGQIYLNCANMAPQLKSVAQAGMQAMGIKNQPWQITPDDWFSGVERVRALAAQLFGSATDDIAIIPSASYGLSLAAKNVALQQGQVIVLLEEQFPSNFYVWNELAKERGASIRTIKLNGAATWTEPLLAALDEQVAVVAVPHCHWTDGRLVDLTEVSKRCKELGAALVIDNSQCLGAKPFDVKTLDPDFVVSVGYKWLMGPYGLSYLYAAPKYHQSGKPLEQTWYARKDAENFARLADYKSHYRQGARRFDMGEVPLFANMAMAEAALSQVLAWGVENIAQSTSELTACLDKHAAGFGIKTIAPENRVGHISGIRFSQSAPADLGTRLSQSGIHVSIRGDAVRLSPHVYNSEDEVRQFVETSAGFLDL